MAQRVGVDHVAEPAGHGAGLDEDVAGERERHQHGVGDADDHGRVADCQGPSLPAVWLAAAVFGLQHTAAAQVATGRLTTREAAALCLRSTMRLCGDSGHDALRPVATDD
jgi:hypothetical protein